ncbi:hypothetical protein T08_1471 [Trichinella sp. T8]|nr:hypothetical protein T08_1471 [Trichinella sp. T8]
MVVVLLVVVVVVVVVVVDRKPDVGWSSDGSCLVVLRSSACFKVASIDDNKLARKGWPRVLVDFWSPDGVGSTSGSSSLTVVDVSTWHWSMANVIVNPPHEFRSSSSSSVQPYSTVLILRYGTNGFLGRLRLVIVLSLSKINFYLINDEQFICVD